MYGISSRCRAWERPNLMWLIVVPIDKTCMPLWGRSVRTSRSFGCIIVHTQTSENVISIQARSRTVNGGSTLLLVPLGVMRRTSYGSRRAVRQPTQCGAKGAGSAGQAFRTIYENKTRTTFDRLPNSCRARLSSNQFVPPIFQSQPNLTTR
jgi:hypothetical protein